MRALRSACSFGPVRGGDAGSPENTISVSISAGQVLGGFTMACGDGAIEVLEAQRAGKKPMAGGELLRGWDRRAGLG